MKAGGKGLEDRDCPGIPASERRGGCVYRPQGAISHRPTQAAPAPESHAGRSREAPPIEPIAHRQDGGRRPLGVAGSSDQVVVDPWHLAPRIVPDYLRVLICPCCITPRSAAAASNAS